MKGTKKVVRVIIFIIMVMMSFTFLYPFFFMFINAMKKTSDYYTNKFNIPLENMSMKNFEVMISQFKILRLFLNSGIIVVCGGVLCLVFSVIASYAFAKLKFRGKELTYTIMIATMSIPAQVTMIPMYIMFSKVNLVNTYLSVILVYLGGCIASNILLLTSYFKSISDELIEASRMDGSGFFMTIWNVIVPMGLPAIMINIIFNAFAMWNDLFTPLLLLTKTERRTVMVALASLISRYKSDPPYQLAGLFLSTIPCVLIYLAAQKYIIKGLTEGAIK